MKQPFFTIAIAAYNYDQFLSEAIRSVLMQDFDDYEILVCDDCSQDNSWAVALTYSQKDSRVRCIQNSENMGSRATINRCYREALGQYVIPLQADDAFLLPDYLRRVHDVISLDQDIGFLFSEGLFVSAEAGVVRYYIPMFESYSGDGVYFSSILTRMPPWPSFTVIKKELLDLSGGENESLIIADFELTLRLACATKVAYLSKASVISRVHQEAQGIRMGCAEEAAVCRNNLECLDLYETQVEDDPYLIQVIEGAKRLYLKGHRKSNNQYYNKDYLSVQLNPILSKVRAENKRLAIYASGEHTRRLFEWTDLCSDDVMYIIDSNKTLEGREMEGCRIVSPTESVLAAPDIIVISTASYQDDIYYSLSLCSTCNAELINLYPSQFTGAEKAKTMLQKLDF